MKFFVFFFTIRIDLSEYSSVFINTSNHMTEFNNDIWEIIASMLNGDQISPEDMDVFNNWLAADESNRKTFETIQNSRHPQKELDKAGKEKIYAKIETSIQADRGIRRINYWAYSAVASIAILLTLTISHFTRDKLNAASFIEVNIPYGVKSKVSLPDKTEVYLNSGSSLKYPATFSGNKRLVYLKGEAYFNVNKNPDQPFIVKTESLSVKVFGTHFNVKAYPEEDFFETTLLEGSVGVYRKEIDNALKLIPNQKLTYNRLSNKAGIIIVDAELTASWKDGKYYFEKETLQSIACKLERNFNIPVRITSPDLNKELFSGLFDKSKTIYQILDIMKLYKSFNYRSKNDTISIYKIKRN